MLREADIFDPAGTLPDVSKSVVISNAPSASALAGINSGRDYAAAIKAAVERPLDRVELKREILAELDLDPTISHLNKGALERRNLARELRQSVGSGRRPGGTYRSSDYTEPGLPEAPPLPGTETPVARSSDSGNLLDTPPPAESVDGPATDLLPFPPSNPPGTFDRPSPLLPPPLQPARPWSPADIFRNIFP